ncbi:extracellular solute-binding protein [Devosia sp. PTR5]|uniref:Extracellular solute-binding protein n=1 Tax=Devosia oryzisoli TaxID=2774138 RepID=A0A927FZ58_9HYPH|nr:extracellular solute-binding protein [Devosia oryzisoli]MBD8066756.1 extracellular solute-binding protein [Devosia oryzisoli]
MNKTLIRYGAALGALLIAVPAFAQDLTFWSWRQEDRAQYEKFIDAFEADNPDITIKFETFEATNYNTILSTALAGGTGPDLMMVRAYGGLETLSSAGYLMPLDGEKIEGLDAIPANYLTAETQRSDNTVYAIPFAVSTQFILYNKQIFADNGIEEPQTWDELVAACEKLKAAGIMPFANGTATAWQNEVVVGALTSSIMGKDFYEDLAAGKTDFTDERYIDALTHLKDITAYFPDGFIGLDYPSAQQLFTSGMAAMFAGGSYEIANFRNQNPDLDIGVMAAPGETADDPKLVATYVDGGYAANAKTEHPEAALKFLNYLASAEFGQAFADDLSNISTIPGVEFKDPVLAKVAELDKQSIPYIMLTDFRYGEPTGSVLLQAEVQKMLDNKATPEEVGKAVTEGIAAWYEPFQK